ncbi:MAG: hypothetical protein ILM98_00075 [Kiritimatiellae bacterium]|nr:hypothetical protein [Kiritimatiellia bacterium]
MKTIPTVFSIALLGVALPFFAAADASAPLALRVAMDGSLSFDGGTLGVAAFRPGWAACGLKADWTDFSPERAFEVVSGPTSLFDGRARWTAQPDGTVKGVVTLTARAAADMQCVALAAAIENPPAFPLGGGREAGLDLPAANGQTLHLDFGGPVARFAQDSRQWGGKWDIRFGDALGPRSYAAGDTLSWEVSISAPGGIALRQVQPFRIEEGEHWVRLDYKKDVRPGSALDLSRQGFQDAPAGKYGWLKAVGNHFEFEGLPGVGQRFYGVNLCFSSNYPDHDMADRLADRFARCGYNAVRIHHHDGAWAAAYAGREAQVPDPRSQVNGEASTDLSTFQLFNLSTSVDVVNDDIDRLDYFLAKCFEKGIYATTDLYVSRPVAWRDIGIDRDGELDPGLFKTYVALHDGAFSNWCEYAADFLNHVNPYTGRAYKDEPAMPLVSLINENALAVGWGEGDKANDPVIASAWREYGGTGPIPNPWNQETKEAGAKFDDWILVRAWSKCSDFVRSLGCRALLTNDNCGGRHAEGDWPASLYDYIDTHFYVDHPAFPGKPWELPSKCGNENPVVAGKPGLLHKGWAENASKPHVITEWNFSGPGRYRGMGGILTGALAAEGGWDGLWRFAYAHHVSFLDDHSTASPNYFDCALDPLMAASDLASVCLFLGSDRAPAQQGEGLSIDRDRGAMTLVTPRTCGGFAESGSIDAGPLKVEILPLDQSSANPRPVPATVWVTSLDGAPVASSSRLLLVHLTDVQGDGREYADDTCTLLLKWGRNCLIEVGEADVELRLDDADCIVFALDTTGRRVGVVPSRIEDGALRFRVSTRSRDGGRIFYEIFRPDAECASEGLGIKE